jgi:phage shock protein C
MKKLYKSDTNRTFSGVLGGLGEYYDIDPTLLRLAFIVLTIVTGIFPCVIGYIIAGIIVPDKPKMTDEHVTHVEPTPSSENK